MATISLLFSFLFARLSLHAFPRHSSCLLLFLFLFLLPLLVLPVSHQERVLCTYLVSFVSHSPCGILIGFDLILSKQFSFVNSFSFPVCLTGNAAAWEDSIHPFTAFKLGPYECGVSVRYRAIIQGLWFIFAP